MLSAQDEPLEVAESDASSRSTDQPLAAPNGSDTIPPPPIPPPNFPPPNFPPPNLPPPNLPPPPAPWGAPPSPMPTSWAPAPPAWAPPPSQETTASPAAVFAGEATIATAETSTPWPATQNFGDAQPGIAPEAPRTAKQRRRWPWALACGLLCILLAGTTAFAASADKRATANRDAALDWQNQLRAQERQLEELVVTQTELNKKVASLSELLTKAEGEVALNQGAVNALNEELTKTRAELLAVEDQLAELGGTRSRARDDVILGR